MAEGNLNRGVVFDVDSHSVMVRTSRNQDGFWLDDGIALQMVGKGCSSSLRELNTSK